MSSDRVIIEELQLAAVIGVYAWEHEVRQELRLSLELATDIRPAAAGDDLSLTLDYKVIADRLTEYAAASDFQLIESLAEGIAAVLMGEFAVTGLRLRLDKPGAIPTAATVGVVIERGAAFSGES